MLTITFALQHKSPIQGIFAVLLMPLYPRNAYHIGILSQKDPANRLFLGSFDVSICLLSALCRQI